MNDVDATYMRRALELAEQGRGFVEPNPLVGAVVVRDGGVVGEGWHERYGQAHAEVHALAAAGAAARGATLYVTLEPCCHHGKTPPCTDAILRSGIGRVVAAMLDPFPEVAGRGAALLRAAGVTVEFGVGEAEARHLNAPYLKLLATGRPYVILKWAMTLDGKICTRTGDSRWISNGASRRLVHELRGRMDAIIVGSGTGLADDPMLTARPPGPRRATRVVLDSQCRLPLQSRLVQTAREVPLLVVTGDETACAGRRQALEQAGVEVVGAGAQGRPGIPWVLDVLGKRRMTNVLVEGGAEVLGSFVDAEALDEVLVFIAPVVLGGGGKSPVEGRGVDAIADALRLANCKIQDVEGDILLRGSRLLGPFARVAD